ncbi:MAG: hypothetical protein JO129_01070 [Candidatus Dependentiae bacterium]|nr:hypothetical protein [Candidatus Dependentiae bacterium]
MNKILVIMILLFSTFLYTSDNHKEMITSDDSDSHHHKKLKKNPNTSDSNQEVIDSDDSDSDSHLCKELKKGPKFHFRQWDEHHQYSADEYIPQSNKKYNYPPVDTSRLLLQYDLKQMREKMNSISHCLKGDALALRINGLDEELLEINNPRIKAFVMEIVQKRILTSSSSQYDFEPVPAKIIRRLINSFALCYEDYMPEIVKEPYALKIMFFIEAELLRLREDFNQRVSDVYKQNVILGDDSIFNNKIFHLRFAVKNVKNNVKNMAYIINSYRTIRSISFSKTDTQSRNLFNQLHLLEKSVICDDNLTKADLQLRYQNIKELYQTLELSEQAKIYAQGSLDSLEKSIEDFES